MNQISSSFQAACVVAWLWCALGNIFVEGLGSSPIGGTIFVICLLMIIAITGKVIKLDSENDKNDFQFSAIFGRGQQQRTINIYRWKKNR